MAKLTDKKEETKRSETYEPKVKFKGTFEDLVKISTTGAGTKKKTEKKEKK